MSTLIVYATRHGATEKAAHMLAQELPENTELFNLKSGKNIDLEKYEGIIMGSSVYAGQLRKELKDFVNKGQEELLQKDLGLFLCGARTAEAEQERVLQQHIPAEVRERLRVRGHFGYQFHFDKMNLFEKLIVKKIVGIREDQDELSEESIASFAASWKESSS